MDEIEERLLALLETAEQQAQTNKEQSADNRELLNAVRELVTHMEETKPTLDSAVKTAQNFYSKDNLQILENVCGNAVYQATNRNIDKAVIGKVENEIAEKFEGTEFNELSAQSREQMSSATTDLVEAGKQAKQASDNLNQSLEKSRWRIIFPVIVVTVICIFLLFIVHLVIRPNNDDIRELQTEIQQLENTKSQSQADLQLMKARYDNALTHANTQFLNGEMYMLVDTSNCDDSDSRRNIKYCRLVGGRPMPKPTPAAIPRRSQQPTINYGNNSGSNPFGSGAQNRSNSSNNPF